MAISGTSVFYVKDGSVFRRDIADPSEARLLASLPAGSPLSLTTDGTDVYALSSSGTAIFRISVDSHLVTDLSLPDGEYDLGVIDENRVARSLSFKGENLLITFADSLQEYAVTGDSAEFTGYAVASGLSAYNRVGTGANKICRLGDNVAVLSLGGASLKLTVINRSEGFDGYGKRFFSSPVNDDDIKTFALGDDSICYYKTGDVIICGLDGENPFTALSSQNVVDLSYQSGIYYVCTTGGTNTTVYCFTESGNACGTYSFEDVNARKVYADVLGNLYVADSTKIYLYGSADPVYTISVSELRADLCGRLYVLSDGVIKALNDEGEFETVIAIDGVNVVSFGMDYDEKELCFITDNSEAVYGTENAGNACLKDVVLPENLFAFTERGETAVCTVKGGANLYGFSATEKEFDRLLPTDGEFLLIGELFIGDRTFCLLANESGIAIADDEKVVRTESQTVGTEDKTVWTTTAVHAYAFPLIWEIKDGYEILNPAPYSVYVGGERVRLEKNTPVTVSGTVTALGGKSFYVAEVTADGETVNCYIPVKFTAENLSENYPYDIYSVITLKACDIYSDAELDEAVISAEDETKARLLEEGKDYRKVAVTINGNTVIGYVSPDSVKNPADTAVRNVLIVLALAASLCGSLTYFLLRKKVGKQ